MDDENKLKKKRSRLEAMMFSVSVLSIFLAVIVTAMNAGDAYAVTGNCYRCESPYQFTWSYYGEPTTSCADGWVKQDAITSPDNCVKPSCYVCYSSNTYKWHSGKPTDYCATGTWNELTGVGQSGCKAPVYSCYVCYSSKTYKWATSKPTDYCATGTWNELSVTEANCKDTTPSVTYYTVTFQSNGGLFDGGLNSYEKTVAKGTDLYFASAGIPSLSRTGYTQDGWRLGTSSGEVHRDYYTINADIFFYANWVPNSSGGGETGGGSTTQYTVTFYPNGGTFANGESTYSITRNAGDEFWFSSIGLPSLTRSGCTQDGWHLGSTTGEIHRDNNVVNSNLSYYANWECSGSSGDTSDKQYTLKYDNNGGTGNISSVTKDSGTTVTIGKTVPKREGYTFKEWNTKKDGKGTSYKEGSTIKLESDVTLYAIWEKAKLTIEFYSGDKVYKKVEVNYGEKLAKIDGPKKDGAIFKGWSTSDYTVEFYDFDKEVKSSFKLYAVFEPDTGNKTVDGDKTEEEVMPPQTGIVLVIITWLVGLGSLGFSVWYHNRNKNLV